MKKNRMPRSFRPDEDVDVLLKDAEQGGLELTEILNKCVRKCGQDVVAQMATDKLKQLKKLSFDDHRSPLDLNGDPKVATMRKPEYEFLEDQRRALDRFYWNECLVFLILCIPLTAILVILFIIHYSK